MTYKPIEEKMQAARIVITNSLSNTAILTALSGYLIDEAYISVGKALLQNIEALHAAQLSEYGEQYAATEAMNTAWANAKAVYTKHLKIARVVLRDDIHLMQSLQLNGRRKDSLTGWMEQARIFYVNALASEAAKAGLAKYGITQINLEEGLALLQALADAKAIQEDEKGEAQKATEVRDAALDELDEWLDDFKQVAFVALEDDKQLLESLGFGPQ